MSIQHEAHTIPIGVLPLGKENRFYKSSPLGSGYHKSPARWINTLHATYNIHAQFTESLTIILYYKHIVMHMYYYGQSPQLVFSTCNLCLWISFVHYDYKLLLLCILLCTSRRLGEATMNIISGTAVPVNLMMLQPENGRTLYSLSGVEWGALNDATENRDRYGNVQLC